MEIWIRNALLIDPRGRRRVDVLVRGERVAEVVPGDRDREGAGPSVAASPLGAAGFDAQGLWLLPGGVDGHVHFGMPVAEGVASLGWRASSEAALLGGTTTVVDFVNPARAEALLEAVERTLAAAEGDGRPGDSCLCDYGLHATFTDVADERLAELGPLLARGLCTFKAFLAYPGRLMLSPGEMERLMRAVATRGGRLMVHAEDGPACAAAEAALVQTGRTAAAWHPAAHPARAELDAVEAVLGLAARAGCPLTLAHLSLAGSVERLRAARRAGGATGVGAGAAGAAGEVCLHHLFLDRSLYALSQESALRATLSPPLRERSDAEALLAALAEGELDLLATDHCEFPLALKSERARHGFAAVPNGAGGVGERLTLSHALAVATGRLSAERWVEACCEAPARLLGLDGRKGRIAPGCDADLVLFDPEAEHRWAPLPGSDPAASLWGDTPCRGRVRDVMLRGRWVVREGALLPDVPPGRYLSRSF